MNISTKSNHAKNDTRQILTFKWKMQFLDNLHTKDEHKTRTRKIDVERQTDTFFCQTNNNINLSNLQNLIIRTENC